MTKATLERVDAEIKRWRTQVTKLHADLEDYLDVIEARQQTIGKRTHTQAAMKRRYGVK